MATYMATHYKSFRTVGLTLGGVTLVPALVVLYEAVAYTFYGGLGSLSPMATFELFLCLVAAFVFAALAVHWHLKMKNAGTVISENDSLFFWSFSSLSGIFLLGSIFIAFFGKEISFSQVFESVHRIFVPHQYSLPVIGAWLVAAVVVIFIGALIVYRNRGPLLIFLALLCVLPAWSGISHWAKSEQRNHWFGYWFGHDMFTPPFGIYPEMTRNTILFGGTDPGRFCPTYMIFCESFIPHSCQPKEDQKFDRRDVYIITQNALADGTYLDYIRAQYFRSAQQDPPFFRELMKRYWWAPVGMGFVLSVIWVALDFWLMQRHRKRNVIIICSIWGIFLIIVFTNARSGGFANGISQAAYNLLDKPFTKLGANIETRRRAEGVYPPNEIYTPSGEDLNQSFQDYAADLTHRREIGLQHPGEEGVSFENGRVQLSGTVPVMMINGLLCKVIFDRNPTNEFFIEESFPLDWMYPYETPAGIIMKINRNPLSSIPNEVFQKDHEFWTKYSERLCGNWITYDTSVKEIADFAEKVYLQHDYSNFKGDPKFVRDDGGQKAFSKLRSSIAGVYAWRLDQRFCPPEYQPKNAAERQALIKETDFAFKQAFAFCPYSPEAVYRYVNFLLPLGRFDDAIIVAQTCSKLDPYNEQVKGLIENLKQFKEQAGARADIQQKLQPMEEEAQTNPANFRNVLQLGDIFKQMQETNAAMQLFQQSTALAAEKVLTNSNENTENLTALAQIYAELGNLQKVESILEHVAQLYPNRPETHYDLAALKTVFGKNAEAFKELKIAIDESNARLKTNSTALNLLNSARNDPRFNSIRSTPEFQKIVPPQ